MAMTINPEDVGGGDTNRATTPMEKTGVRRRE